MKIVPARLEEMEKEMFKMADNVSPGILGRFLTTIAAARVSNMLRVGGWALRAIRLDYEIKEMEHLFTSLEEVGGGDNSRNVGPDGTSPP